MPKYPIVLLNADCDRAGFDCGEPALNSYIQRNANQDKRKNVAKTFVALDEDIVIGFYSWATSSISKENFPESIQKKYSYSDVPCVLLGRLASDLRYRGQGVGSLLMIDVLDRAYRLKEEIEFAYILVDAKNEEARSFYERFDFKVFPDQPQKLYLPVSYLRKMFGH